jgi:hypothetical protein
MDSGHETWHKYHINNKNDYADGYPDLLLSMRDWGRYNLHHRLAYFALNFRSSRFVNGHVLAGFYDTAEREGTKVGT